MPVKYEAGQSTGVSFETVETRTVVVSLEAVNPTMAGEGETVTYTATVEDNLGGPLPATFEVDLLFNGTEVLSDQVLDAGVYDQGTHALSLDFTVPAGVGSFTVKLSWSKQVI